MRELLREMISALSDYGTENPRFEAECLLEHLGISRLKLLTEPNTPVSEDTSSKAQALVKRRTSGEPLQYILGEWEFYGLPFAVGEGVLIPRQDTETLVEIAEAFLKKRPNDERHTADLCAGSGCIGIALAKRCGCSVKSYELSEKAFGFLERNIKLNEAGGVIPVRADVLTAETNEKFDLIVSNPPYLSESDMSALQREVSREPSMALYGGFDGLDFYRKIVPHWLGSLKQGGMLAVEIGIGQESAVMEIFRENGLSAYCEKDACGVNRVVYGTK